MDGGKERTDLSNSSFGFATTTRTLVVPNFVVLVLLVIPIGEKEISQYLRELADY